METSPDRLSWLGLISLTQKGSSNNPLTTHPLHLENRILTAHLLKVQLYALYNVQSHFSFIDIFH